MYQGLMGNESLVCKEKPLRRVKSPRFMNLDRTPTGPTNMPQLTNRKGSELDKKRRNSDKKRSDLDKKRKSDLDKSSITTGIPVS